MLSIQSNIEQNINKLVSDTKYTQQLSEVEIKCLFSIFMSEQQLAQYNLLSLFGKAAQQKQLFKRISDLPNGMCTRIDKRTLSHKSITGYAPLWKQDLHPSKSVITRQQIELPILLPRTLIIEKTSNDQIFLYILLGAKTPNAHMFSAIKAKKSIKFKIYGGFKCKSNMIKICLASSDLLPDPKLMAITKVYKQPNEDFKTSTESLKLEVQLQNILAEQNESILSQRTLTLDDTFDKDIAYVVAELGVDLYNFLLEDEKRKARVNGFLKDMYNKYYNFQNYLCISEFRKEFAIQICDVLCFLHSLKILHGDIKNDNIIIINNIARLIDFGAMSFFGSNESICAPKELLPTHVVKTSLTLDNSQWQKDYFVASLDETQHNQLTQNIKENHPLQDIWAFGIFLFFLHCNMHLQYSFSKMKFINNYENSTHAIEKILHDIFFPDINNCYLLATLQQWQEDQQLPLNQRKYLSMEKIYFQLTGTEYCLSPNIKCHAGTKLAQYLNKYEIEKDKDISENDIKRPRVLLA